MNTCAFLSKAAQQRQDEPAIVHGDDVISYRELHERALAIGGNLLELGLERGDRVAFVLHNSPRVLETVYGCSRALIGTTIRR
ncbi:MAG TPA: AMP-binding protein, partial [Solirubrobacteraceae bacterium]|nr:AMP-binding protein [Solirubrobacteraceae bacterium]